MTSSPFPKTTGRAKGYEPKAVDAFLDRARASFQSGPARAETGSEHVRSVAFPLVRGGYEPGPVDAALARIEDAFAVREREAKVREVGAEVWVQNARALAQEILERLARPEGHKFRRAGVLRYGYRRSEVDLVAKRLVGYFQDGDVVAPEQVRAAAFRMQRNGYSEAQVDALMDDVIEVMLAVAPTQ